MTERLNPSAMSADTLKYPAPTVILSRPALKRCWQKSRDASAHAGAMGSDGVSARRFARNIDQSINSIFNELQSHNFQFQLLRPFFIPKSNGSERVICVPTVRDRLVQRVIGERLTKDDRLQLNNKISFGFIKGDKGVDRAVKEAIKIRTKNEWVLKTDIKSFFDRIPRTLLKKQVSRRLRQSSMVPLLHQVIDCEIKVRNAAERKKIASHGIHRGQGLRQGMPLSPLLSNFSLFEFDRAAIQSGFSLLRYADDLILFGTCRSEVEEGYDFLVQELAKAGHVVPPPGEGSKTEFKPPRDQVEFLGLAIAWRQADQQYVCRMPRSVKQKILDDIASNYSLTNAIKDRRTFHTTARILSNLPASYRSAFRVAEDWSVFEPEVFAACNRSLVQIFIDLFGQDAIAALGDAQRQFLEIHKLQKD